MKKLFVLAFVALLTAPALFASGPNVWQTDDGRRIVVSVDSSGVVDVNGDEGVFREIRGQLSQRGFLGVRLITLTDELREHYRTGDRGILISSVVEDSAAERAGLRAGDILVEANGNAIENRGDLSRVLGDIEEGDVIELRYVRNGVEQYVTASPEIRKNGYHRLFFNQGDLEDRLKVLSENLRAVDVDGEDLEKYQLVLERSMENLEKSMDKVGVFFESPEWEKRVMSIQDCAESKQKIDELTKRVRELERKLDHN